ncbi:uncharacterized protein [Magallana gigas]|uniref:uncharacterized protein isoform X5 n=1 Tax=Magallana gigas TaxID=29159 RepID=UPI0033423F4C
MMKCFALSVGAHRLQSVHRALTVHRTFSVRSLFRFKAQEFEANVLRHVFDDEEGIFLANVIDFEEGRYFIKTEFHEKFVEAIKDNRAKKTTWIYLNGIEDAEYDAERHYTEKNEPRDHTTNDASAEEKK